jgi:hypothetical protein
MPNQSDYYVLRYWRLRRIQDAGSGAQTPDVTFRFLPVLVSGLAYYIAMKTPELMNRVQLLKDDYEQQMDFAAGEDREKAPVRFVPRFIP